jgi:hypothetical protein
MQALAVNGYTEAQVIAALHSPNRQIAFRYDLLDSSNKFKKALTTVTAASIANNSETVIKRTAKFTLRDDTAINYLSDRIKPWVRIKMTDGGWAEFPQGVFLLSTPPRKEDTTGTYREIEAYDLLQLLTDDKVDTRYTVASGINYITAVGTVLTGASIADQNLTPTTLTLPADRDWEPGTIKLQIINDLLSAINYYSLEFNENGQAVAKPYISPSARASEYAYKNDSTSVIFPGVEQHIDLFAIPNKWVLVKSEPDSGVLIGSYTNTNPSSPTSTVSRGRTIISYQSKVEAADQATITALAARAAYEASQVYEAVPFETAIMPFHSNADCLTLEHTRLGIYAKFEEVSWSFDFTPGARMKHELRRTVTI